MSETNDGAGGKWLQINSTNTADPTTSMPYGCLGNLVTFAFTDLVTNKQAFSVFEIDNSIYTNLPPSGQSFVMETNYTNFITAYPVTPYGTPVPWLQSYGFTNDFSAAELSDPDGDGISTWQEYFAGTNPRDKTSAFKIQSISRARADAPYQVVYSTVAGRTYRVDGSTDLVNWTTLQDNIAGTGSVLTFTDTRDPVALTRQFYRISTR
jgi:hypothetical protein